MNLFSEENGNGADIRVLKRGGNRTQVFEKRKIEQAVERAFSEIGYPIDANSLTNIAYLVEAKTRLRYPAGVDVPVESIQDFVETSLMETGFTEAAKAYILYRSKHEEIRDKRLKPDPNAIADYIHPGKYSRYVPSLKRREIYSETVDRTKNMHIRKFPHLKEEIEKAFEYVYKKRVLPSMRSMQFAGDAIEFINNRLYNCSFMHVDKIRAFSDTLYLLLCGCGVGYSVQYDHVDKLPALGYVDRAKVRHHVIADSIEGWANALKALIESYIKGYYLELSYHKVRPEGAPLKTAGGKAPGHMRLKQSLERIRGSLDAAQGRQLRPIECHDIMCHAADAVLSGGIRRSAMISLFSPEDGEMMVAKTGKWYETYPWRANANNSVVLNRNDIRKKQFKRIFKCIKEFGEPGFLFVNDLDLGTNPCGEISLDPRLLVDKQVLESIERKRAQGRQIPKVKEGDVLTGVQKCNLTEINAAVFETPEDFYEAARVAAFIGTLQAAYTDFSYLGWVSELIAEREALLGVSMTGMVDSPEISLNPEYQRKASEIAVQENKRVAKLLGINEASRVTCVKPAGTSSLSLGCVGSGIHPHHSRRYIRRVTANRTEPVFNFFKSVNPELCVKKPNGDWVIEFPIQAPDDAILKEDMSAIDFLSMVRSTQRNWVAPGTAHPERSPGAVHNVSNTVQVNADEWDDVCEYVWNHKDDFAGITFIPSFGDKVYAFAPLEAIKTEADEEKWNHLLKYYTPVDYTKMVEDGDETDLQGELACAGGACEL